MPVRVAAEQRVRAGQLPVGGALIDRATSSAVSVASSTRSMLPGWEMLRVTPMVVSLSVTPDWATWRLVVV